LIETKFLFCTKNVLLIIIQNHFELRISSQL